MRPYRPARLAGLHGRTDDPVSHLLVNLPDAQLGLRNLLDLQSHEISTAGGRRVHRLTFLSGECLQIESDGRVVSVEGRHISYSSCERRPSETWLSDPARDKR